MGTIFGLAYATLSMGYFELTFYRIYINKFGETLRQFFLENGCRLKLTQKDYWKSLILETLPLSLQ